MKTLYFDLEHGSKTLGSKNDIQSMFGYPVLHPYTWDQFLKIIGGIYKQDKVLVKQKIGDLEVSNEDQQVVLKNGTIVDALVVDTVSELCKKYQRSLCDKNGTMKLQDWGKLKNKIDTALEFITRIPGIVICTCHSKMSTMDDGTTRIQPYVDGSSKEDLSKWFDFVFYSKTIINPSNKREYVWITERSEMYNDAKDRSGLLGSQIPQDYQLVIDAANKKEFDGAKILVIGSPGSGKTYSLQTLNKEVSNENTNN